MYKQRSKRRRFSNNSRNTRFSSRRNHKKGFDPRTVIGKTQNPQEKHVVTHAFSDFDLVPKLSQNISDQNFVTPTPIQDLAIPQIIDGNDVVGIANTGTGKTAAFLIPLINRLAQNNSRTLIVAPTRELAIQIEDELHRFSRGMNVYSAICIGGVPIHAQIRKLKRNPHFVVGTPGRLLDLKNRRNIDFNNFSSIVLDEVDRMLDMGFIHDIKKIITDLPKERQSLFFSATLDPKVKDIMHSFLTDPEIISVRTADISTNVHQEIVELKGRNKKEVLCELLNKERMTKVLIFMRTKRSADALHKKLSKSGYQTAVMHGNKSQNQRQRSLEKFRTGKATILIATDVASRGIDVDDISHVINHDLPETYEDYIHRIGRTGRANKKGTALSFVS